MDRRTRRHLLNERRIPSQSHTRKHRFSRGFGVIAQHAHPAKGERIIDEQT